MPEVGSSKNMIFESPMNAMATESLLFCPPDRFLDNASYYSIKSTSAIVFMMAASFSAGSIP